MANQRTVALLHTVHSLAPVFESLVREKIPGVATVHFVDETLLRNTIASERLEPETMRSVISYAGNAERNPNLVATLVTCSSLGPAVDHAQPFLARPLLRVDYEMTDRAVQLGSKIGVLATLQTTLEPTKAILERQAQRHSQVIDIEATLCEGAFSALISGDRPAHDALVREAADRMANQVDVLVLAQASMASVLPEEIGHVSVLSSPVLAVDHLRRVVEQAETDFSH